MPDIELHSARPPPGAAARTGGGPRRGGRPRGAWAEARAACDNRMSSGCAPGHRSAAPWRVNVSIAEGGRVETARIARSAFRRIDVEEFASLPICPDCDLWPYIEDGVAIGVPVQEIFEDLLAPTARRLGDLWESDDCDFLGVTTGAHRLQIAMRRLSLAWRRREGTPSALFLPAPGRDPRAGPVDRDSRLRAGRLEHGYHRRIRRFLRRTPTTGSISWPSRSVAIIWSAAWPMRPARVRRISRNRNVFLLVGGPRSRRSLNWRRLSGPTPRRPRARGYCYYTEFAKAERTTLSGGSEPGQTWSSI